MQSYVNIKSIHLALSQLVSKTSPLVGFKSKAYDWLGFEFEARRATIGGIQISESRRLVGFKIPLFVPRILRSSLKKRPRFNMIYYLLA